MKKVQPQRLTAKGYVCPTCHHSRFKTIAKGSSYECRNCHQVVAVDVDKFNRKPK